MPKPQAHQLTAWLVYLLIVGGFLTLALRFPAAYIWVTYEDPDHGSRAASIDGHATLVGPSGPLEPSAPLPPEILVSAAPAQAARDDFVDPTGRFVAGAWATSAYHRRALPFDRWELMHIVEGETTLADPDGGVETVRVGDTSELPYDFRKDANSIFAPCQSGSASYLYGE